MPIGSTNLAALSYCDQPGKQGRVSRGMRRSSRVENELGAEDGMISLGTSSFGVTDRKNLEQPDVILWFITILVLSDQIISSA